MEIKIELVKKHLLDLRKVTTPDMPVIHSDQTVNLTSGLISVIETLRTDKDPIRVIDAVSNLFWYSSAIALCLGMEKILEECIHENLSNAASTPDYMRILDKLYFLQPLKPGDKVRHKDDAHVIEPIFISAIYVYTLNETGVEEYSGKKVAILVDANQNFFGWALLTELEKV